jgi:TPR repeat protein
LLLPHAENGNTDCQYLLAVLYQNGEKFAKRRGEALVWMRRAADAGNRKAIEAIAAASGPEPGKETEAMYLAAARKGESWAQTKIGMRYVAEGADAQRLAEGVRWLKTAADQNDTEALRVLSTLAAEGRGVAQSDTDAYNFMSRAAELGSPEAQYELANILAEGRGMPRDMDAAIAWGRKAADQGYAPAQLSLGRGLIKSSNPEDKKEAIDLLQKAVTRGNVDAVLFLATAIGKGDYGLTKDEAGAEKLLLPWAEKGNADCQFVLAALYQHGEIFADRRNEVAGWLQRAADQGHSRAIEILKEAANAASQ